MLIEVHKIISEPLGIEQLEEGGQIKVTGFQPDSDIDRYCGLKVGAVIKSINISREFIIMKELLLTNDDDDVVLRW